MRLLIILGIFFNSISLSYAASSSHDTPEYHAYEKKHHCQPPKEHKPRKFLKALRIILGLLVGGFLGWLAFKFLKGLILSTGAGFWFTLLDLGIVLLGFYILFAILIITLLLCGATIGCRAPYPIEYYE